MFSSCFKCRNNTESKNPKLAETKSRRIMLLSNCAVCNRKESRFMKEQEASGLLNSLGLKRSLSKIPLVSSILF